ncbi:hypothetical protein CDAR_461101 [Caerostris darwini]|uniref:Uncharacterized protein n=1 Tax=Caerostris darwini TaxID=1538125 RepID=A0AAV4W0D5_9ARAC|nr:hypothetical protein CDAR_461101 [Caerostris darwini]
MYILDHASKYSATFSGCKKKAVPCRQMIFPAIRYQLIPLVSNHFVVMTGIKCSGTEDWMLVPRTDGHGPRLLPKNLKQKKRGVLMVRRWCWGASKNMSLQGKQNRVYPLLLLLMRLRFLNLP